MPPTHWPETQTKLLIDGPTGVLELAVGAAVPGATRLAVICHPHSLHGGSMDNKVVTMLERTLRDAGAATIRFNFRGVGASGGAFDDGNGEGDDLAAVGADALVFAPTHGANLDAIVLGLALERLGLPPALYLAGEHLYRNPLVGRLMGPLGAVRIDRARADRRYLAVLAAYVAALAARGAALTIFPGATRRRDGTLEHDLRLGLIAAAARAAAAQGRRLHVVPVTINLQIVLEAACR